MPGVDSLGGQSSRHTAFSGEKIMKRETEELLRDLVAELGFKAMSRKQKDEMADRIKKILEKKERTLI